MTDRRFGTINKFGTTNKFGASSLLGGGIGFSFGLEIDWDNDRHFDGTNEATHRLMAYKFRRGRQFFFNSSGEGFEPVQVGEITFTLKNGDRRFDPYYVGGELFEALQKNPMCRFIVRDYATGVIHDFFFGYVVDIRPAYNAMMDTVEIVVQDAIKKLKEKNISSSSVYNTVQYDDQIALALTLAGWVDGVNIDDTLSDTMNYHWFRGQKAFSEITSLVDAVFGLFFVAKDGAATYKSRVSSDTSVLTLDESDIDYDYGIQAPSPREVVRNVVNVYVRTRTSQTGVELWRMSDTPQIATGTGSPIWANYSYNDEEAPATSITEPVATTDYLAFDNADGTGTERTANFSFARTGFATASKFIPTNSGSAAHVTLLKIRGTAIVADKYTYKNSQDDTSINTFGELPLTIKSDWLQNANTAEEQADLFVERFKDLRFFPRIKFKRSNISDQLTIDLFDLVTVNFPSKSVTGELRVGYIEGSWSIQEPSVMDTIIYLEPNMTVSATGTWIFTTTFPTQFG